MRLDQCNGSFGVCIIDSIHDRYGGWLPHFKTRKALFTETSKRGAYFVRTGALRGRFEYEFTEAGHNLFWSRVPVLDIESNPRINPLWFDDFTSLLDDIKSANLLPYIFLIGGCDYPSTGPLPIDPRNSQHWPGLRLYMTTAVNELGARFGSDFLVEPGNEFYAIPYPSDLSVQLQVDMCDYLHYECGLPYGNMRLSGIDGGKGTTYVDWLQVKAFGPVDLERECTDPIERGRFYKRRGLLAPLGQYGPRLGYSLHEIGYPRDCEPDGTNGRPRINRYQNYIDRRMGPMAPSNDGVNYTPDKGFVGNTPDELREVYKAVIPDLIHNLAGGVGTWENLSQSERIWTPYPGIPADKYVETMNFGQRYLAELDAMAETYRDYFGVEPYNKLYPVGPDPIIPNPDPEPEPAEPDPEENKSMKLFTFSKRFPFLDVHYRGWKKALTKEQFRVHTDTLWLTWGLPAGLALVGWGLLALIKWLFNLVF